MIGGRMTQKLQRMTPNPTNPKNTLQKSQKLSPIFATIQEVGLKVGKKINTPPCPARVLPPSSMALSQSCFSYTTTQQLLLRLNHCAPPLASRCRPPPRTRPPPLPPHVCWLLFFVVVVSVVVAPPPPTVVACPLLHPPRLFSRRCPPPHPTVVASP